ncbi:MAG: hypothetical protein GXO15_03645 [Crenarchaeota archaeon]|nr:hypothetical protein [Thermoproteota archaeon]
MTVIEQLLREMDENPEAAERLVRRLAVGLVRDSTAAALTLEALLSRAATRDDIERLERRLDRIEARLEGLTRWMIGLLVTIWATLAAILVPIALRLPG